MTKLLLLFVLGSVFKLQEEESALNKYLLPRVSQPTFHLGCSHVINSGQWTVRGVIVCFSALDDPGAWVTMFRLEIYHEK